MDNPLLFLLLGFGLGIAGALALALKNKTTSDQPEDSLAALHHNATKSGLYDPEERRDASVPTPLEMPEKPKRGRPKKIPVLEPQREPLVFTRARRNAKLN
jgi:hypothetical protein